MIREERHRRQLKMGLVNCALSDRKPAEVPNWNLSEEELRQQVSTNEVARAVGWNGLSEEQKRFQATEIGIHAAMIDRMDREIGRVLDQLKAMGTLENTIAGKQQRPAPLCSWPPQSRSPKGALQPAQITKRQPDDTHNGAAGIKHRTNRDPAVLHPGQ